VPDDSYGRAGSYGTDWALGATLGAQGIIFVGDIPADLSQPYTPPPGWEWGFGIVPAPDPSTYVTPHPLDPERELDPDEELRQSPPAPEPDDYPEPYPPGGQPNPLIPNPSTEGPPVVPERGPGPPVLFDPGPPAAGGPEERAPPDFDRPLPSEPPPGQFPSRPPPIEGEYIPRGREYTIWDDEGWPQYGWGDRRQREFDAPSPWWPIARRVGGIVLGPWGNVATRVIEAGLPEVLGSGELPFPPIPPVTMPEPPRITLPEPTSFPIPDPAIPGFDRPTPPEVITVTPPAPVYQPAPTRSSQTVPSSTSVPWPLIGALLGSLLSPRRSRWRQPSPFASTFTDPLTPPPGEFFPGTTPQPLTPVQGDTLPSAPPAQLPPQQLTQEDQCNCQSRGKQRKKPRKCLTRAPLIWAGGPKKGKAAGTRCVKFEDYL
jgi:hypothetical protein